MSSATDRSLARRWGRLSLGVLVSLAALLLLLGLLVPLVEERFLFYPSSEVLTTAEELGLEAEDLRLERPGAVVHAVYLPTRGTAKAQILFSHGNGGNLTGRLELAGQLVELGLAVLLYDYQGYGQSTGRPTVSGSYGDGEAALAALVERAGGTERVVLFGRSLGGAVSYELAARHPDVAAIITDATFTSVPDVARTLPFLRFFAPLVRTRMDNRRRAAELALPKLILHGTADELIPIEMARQLHRAARPPVELVEIDGAGHNDTFLVGGERYFGAIARFIDRALPEAPSHGAD